MVGGRRNSASLGDACDVLLRRSGGAIDDRLDASDGLSRTCGSVPPAMGSVSSVRGSSESVLCEHCEVDLLPFDETRRRLRA